MVRASGLHRPRRGQTHLWRARSCAVLTGIGTILADNPRLDVREVTYFAPAAFGDCGCRVANTGPRGTI